jgi:hypothetical protein
MMMPSFRSSVVTSAPSRPRVAAVRTSMIIKRSGDRRDRNRSLRKPELIVDGGGEALGIGADFLDRHAIELKRLTGRHALLLPICPAA